MSSSPPPTVTIQRHQATNQFYEESLGESVRLRMMLIPAGEFMMGSPADEPARSPSEGSQHEVSVASFFLGKYPVTQAQWRVVASLSQVERSLNPDPSRSKGDTRPGEGVWWEDAIEFCARLTEYTQRQYRLPTEAEWEYACRAGTTTPFHFGETMTPELANYKWGQENSSPTNPVSTTPVGSFGVANAFGLCDMHGNVWEWCQDHWHDNYDDENVPCDGSAWLDYVTIARDESFLRVLRGGSWLHHSDYCRAAFRGSLNNGFLELDDYGFRVACSAPRDLSNLTENV